MIIKVDGYNVLINAKAISTIDWHDKYSARIKMINGSQIELTQGTKFGNSDLPFYGTLLNDSTKINIDNVESAIMQLYTEM